jgi:hypothetical protein
MIGPSPLFGYAPSALTTTYRRIWAFCMAAIAARAPSSSTVWRPVPRGPRAEITAGDNLVADASGGAENRDSHGTPPFDLGE